MYFEPHVARYPLAMNLCSVLKLNTVPDAALVRNKTVTWKAFDSICNMKFTPQSLFWVRLDVANLPADGETQRDAALCCAVLCRCSCDAFTLWLSGFDHMSLWIISISRLNKVQDFKAKTNNYTFSFSVIFQNLEKKLYSRLSLSSTVVSIVPPAIALKYSIPYSYKFRVIV